MQRNKPGDALRFSVAMEQTRRGISRAKFACYSQYLRRRIAYDRVPPALCFGFSEIKFNCGSSPHCCSLDTCGHTKSRGQKRQVVSEEKPMLAHPDHQGYKIVGATHVFFCNASLPESIFYDGVDEK